MSEKKPSNLVFPYGFRRQSIHWLCYQAKYVDSDQKILIVAWAASTHISSIQYPVITGYWSSEITPNLFMLRMLQRKSALTLIVLRSETLRSQLILSQRPIVHINWPRLKPRVLRYQTLCQLPNSPMLVIKILKPSLLLQDVWHGIAVNNKETFLESNHFWRCWLQLMSCADDETWELRLLKTQNWEMKSPTVYKLTEHVKGWFFIFLYSNAFKSTTTANVLIYKMGWKMHGH